MVKIGFIKLGDCCWPEHIGIFTAPIRVAVQYKIPLLIWGENSQFEYGGPAAKRQNHILDRNWLEQFQFRLCVLCLERLKLTSIFVGLALLDDLDDHRDNAQQHDGNDD